MSGKSQFEQGHSAPVKHQKVPGLESELSLIMFPTPRKALTTRGDSGIGRSIAILYVMEGADSFIAYLPEEEKDAQETKNDRDNCKKLVDAAVKAMGGIDILVNNHAYQMMVEDIKDPSDFNTNIYPFFYLSKYTLPHMKKGIAPGPVWTPLIPSTMTDEAMKQFVSPMGRPSQLSEIATCFVFLASIDSSPISGQTIHANGGVVNALPQGRLQPTAARVQRTF
ncbi:NAD(P)-binding protein [Lindgomyces ingoldianus]|uniref:NAD(P)-binding protein n=1 Tax=Lindgomyces ingoldianus TaxID=673940 RepID=A0ACB6QX08_9PLEO|nr:NAD(P)-binding protein [Lindgomyces ingoldianus]KAF2471564.1 NAD(P)-binding protein [Lindgomyces ingoldianus]